MEYDNLYFSWDGDPAVFAPNVERGVDEVFFIGADDENWRKGDGPVYADISLNGARLSKPDFESEFGTIGADLPAVPTT